MQPTVTAAWVRSSPWWWPVRRAAGSWRPFGARLLVASSLSWSRPVVTDEAPRVLQLLGPSTGGIRRHVAFLTDQLRLRGWSVTTAGPAGVLADLDHVVAVPWGVRGLRALFREA